MLCPYCHVLPKFWNWHFRRISLNTDAFILKKKLAGCASSAKVFCMCNHGDSYDSELLTLCMSYEFFAVIRSLAEFVCSSMRVSAVD
jgi:hypothetical protein